MNENKKIARTAGLLYLTFILIQSFSMLYVDSTIYVSGDAASTINNLLAHEWLFRAGHQQVHWGGINKGRPNANDLKQAEEFAKNLTDYK